MRLIVLFLTLSVFLGCAKPPEGPNPNSNLYIAQSFSPDKNSFFPCYACVTLETTNFRDVRISFTDTDEQMGSCMGRGTAFYISQQSTLVFPQSVEQGSVQWVLTSQGGGQDPECFPDPLILTVEYSSANEYVLDYNGFNFFKIRKY